MLLLIDKIAGLLSPHICKECGFLGSTYCSRCIINMDMHNYPICLICGCKCKTNNLCSICKKKHNLFAGLYCVGERRGSLKRLIGDYKYHSEVASCRPLAKLLVNKTQLSSDVVIICVPTISAHIRERGFDHMLLIARELASLTGASVNNKLLYRTDNLSQHTLKLADRKKLIQKSLAVKAGCPVPDKVLLIDDIWTTGSTLLTAAKLLKRIGVSDVYGAVIARQPGGTSTKKAPAIAGAREISFWRKERDSNPRQVSPHRFSRPAP